MSSTEPGQTVGELGEGAVLGRIFPRLPESASTLVGPGDDAAVIAAPDGRFVVTTDMMVHGPDFRLAWSTPFDLGFKAAATNLSDVAAMGAVPTALVVALAAPADTPVSFHEGFADGLSAACAELAPGCGVVGGDLSVSDTLTIAVTAFGDLEGRAPVTRGGARVGDVVAVAGALGLAGAGLRMLFENGLRDITPLRGWAGVEAQLQPRPPIALGRVAALAGATSMIDLSDGLALDAGRVAAASGVALALSGLTEVELEGGEDHALLATFPGEPPEGFRVIGTVVAGVGVLLDGQPYEPTGWDPFTGWDGGAG